MLSMHGLNCDFAPGGNGQDRQDYRRDFASRAACPQARANRGSAQWFGRHRLKMKIAAGFAVSAAKQIAERVQHVKFRIKGLLFSQGASGYEPLRRDRRARLEALQTGDGRRLPQPLKAQICRELDRPELPLEQIKAVEAERDTLLDAEQTKASPWPPMLLGVRGVGPEFASVLWSEGLFQTA